MRHWHQCDRWRFRGLACPFRHQKEDRDRKTVQDEIRFTDTREARARVAIRKGAPKLAPVLALSAAAARVPAIVPPVLPDLVSDALVQEVTLEAGFVPRTPKPWVPSADDVELLKSIGVPVEALRPFRVAKGVPAEVSDGAMAMSEEAIAEAVVQDRSFPFGVFALPLVFEALRQVRAAMSRAALAPTNAPRVTPFRTSTAGELATRPRVSPNTPASISRFNAPRVHPGIMREPVPVRQGGFGGKPFNANVIMKSAFERTRRRMAPAPQQTSPLQEQDRQVGAP